MLWYVLNGLYLIIWSALLLHCLGRREFYPIIGRRLGTKIFWLFTFVFFNPFLSLTYAVFGVLLRPPEIDEYTKPKHSVAVIAIICVVFVLVLFELPLGGFNAEHVVILNSSETDNPEGGDGTFFKFEPHIGTMKASNKVQAYSSASPGTDARISMRNVMLISQNPNRLLNRIAKEFQKSLVQLPYVETVAYYPYGNWPPKGGLLPDVFITIDMPDCDESNLLRGRKIQAKMEWQASSSIPGDLSNSSEPGKSPIVQFSIEGKLQHVSNMFGIESPQAKYKLEGKNVSSELIKSVKKQFENLLDKYGELPQLPNVLYGTYRETPEFSFIMNDNLRHQISGSRLLKDNDTILQFTDEHQTKEALTGYIDELKSLGWTLNGHDNDYLKMRKGGERIHIYRQEQHNANAGSIISDVSQKPVSEAFMIVHYESCWTKERMQKVIDKLLDIGVGIKTLLIFKEYFQTPEQFERLRAFIEQSSTPLLDGYLVLTRFWIDRGELEKGRETLMLARAMQYAEKGNDVKAEEIKNLAEMLGDESLAEVPVSEETFREIGFIKANEIDKVMIVERGLDEPVLFYRFLEDGGLQTLALRVMPSREPLSSASYRLLIVEKRKGNSSSSEKDGTIAPNSSWAAEYDLHSLMDKDKSVHLKIECLKNERFRFVFTTELI